MRSGMPDRKPPAAFTLVELLVVVTVIVLLLALLVPALDQAIYQAELAVCATNQRGVASGVTRYASANARTYPHRPTLAAFATPARIRQGGPDDRPYLRQALGTLSLLIDPLAEEYDPDRPEDAGGERWIYSHYALWFGMSYPASMGGGQGLRRLGDRLQWSEVSRGGVEQYRFGVLTADHDWVRPNGNGSVGPIQLPTAQWVITSHPDAEGVLSPDQYHSADYEASWWYSGQTHARGPVDLNFAMTDCSVTRQEKVTWDDSQVARVPINIAASGWVAGTGEWMHLPPQQ